MANPPTQHNQLRDLIRETRDMFQERLLNSRTNSGDWPGIWDGRLADGPLATATAIITLTLRTNAGNADDSSNPKFIERCRTAAQRGVSWLTSNANPDGGYGDTIRSKTNISTTCVVWASLVIFQKHSKLSKADTQLRDAVAASIQNIQDWIVVQVGTLEASSLSAAILRRYSSDHTFSVPILMVLALAGLLGKGRTGWKLVPQLPFPLAALPQRWFRRLYLPVVSYAIPALIAIGQVRHHFYPGVNPVAWFIRESALKPTREVLRNVQPQNGGFLEATPLTSFVSMSLIAAGLVDDPVVTRGLDFILNSQRQTGGWPIDTHLATWATTLSIKALKADPDFRFSPANKQTLKEYLLKTQYRQTHPYTGAAPGGWAWTHLPGGVPDADDTAGALIALSDLGCDDNEIEKVIKPGLLWLSGLRNFNGGVATFCAGFGTLPFDQSSPDISAHALLAWGRWIAHVDPQTQQHLKQCITGVLRYLYSSQGRNGEFIPLWFGNEHHPADENPIYGTSRVLQAIHQLPESCLDLLSNKDQQRLKQFANRAQDFIEKAQNPDGSWGGAPNLPGTIEETAVGLDALASQQNPRQSQLNRLTKAASWLKANHQNPASPIGLYFAKLWYFEDLYPDIFATAALNRLHKNIST